MKRICLVFSMLIFSMFCFSSSFSYAKSFDNSGGYKMAKITATSEIQRVLREKDAGTISGMKAMKTVLENMQQQVQGEIASAAVDSWDAFHLPQLSAAIKEHVDNFNVSAKGNLDDFLDNSWQHGENIVNAPLVAAGEVAIGGFGISGEVLSVMKDFTFHKIDGVSNSAWDKIRSELTLGVLGGKTPHEVSKAIGTNLTDPSIFKSIHARANVITHTEMSRVFDKSAHERMKTAAASVEGLQKEWRHDGHPKKPRATHQVAHGQIKDIEKPFEIGSVAMMFPHDPGAPIGEVINCTCTHLPYMKKWAA